MHKSTKLALLFCVAVIAAACSDKKHSPSAEVKSQQPATTPVQDARFSYAGIYPGATAEQAKAAGFNDCKTNSNDNSVSCLKHEPLPDFNNLSVTKASITFLEPYKQSHRISLDIQSKRPQPTCKQGKKNEKWGDLITCDGPTPDPEDDIVEIFGKRQNLSYKYPVWTDCDLYTVHLNRKGKSLTIDFAKDDLERSNNRSTCESFAREQDRLKEKQIKNDQATDFSKSMSSTTSK